LFGNIFSKQFYAEALKKEMGARNQTFTWLDVCSRKSRPNWALACRQAAGLSSLIHLPHPAARKLVYCLAVKIAETGETLESLKGHLSV